MKFNLKIISIMKKIKAIIPCLVLSMTIISCSQKSEKQKSDIKLPNETETALISTEEERLGRHEKIYIFNEGLTDSMVNEICTIKDPFITYNRVENIYTSGKELNSKNNYEKVFFRGCPEINLFEVCFIYRDSYNDFIYDATWFSLGGNEEILTVFEYEFVTTPALYNNNLLVVISKDNDDKYYTDIFQDDCGMKYCGVSRFYEKDSAYIEYFSDVKSYADFLKKIPAYIKFKQAKTLFCLYRLG
jgi:hypothetical protein